MTQTARNQRTDEGGGDGEHCFSSVDPRTGEIVGSYPVRFAQDVVATVREARRAGRWWADLGFAGRRARLDAWRALIARHTDELVTLICAETGKPAADARLEIALVIAHLRWAARQAERVLRRRRMRTGLMMFNHAATVEYRPLGVVGVIGPWNYPAFRPIGSIGSALAAGNAVVFKPSEYTPGVAQRLADLFAEVVTEAPVFTVMTGFGETGSALTAAGVDKIAFIGSTETGRRVMAECARTLTPVLLACGGKDAMIVDADADLDAAAEAAVWGAFANAGQICIGIERVYVVEEVAEEFVDKVAARVRKLRPGGEANADFGPLTAPGQVEVVRRHIDDALARGGRALVGGLESIRPPYVEPVLLVNVPEDSTAITEETLGPVIVLNRVPTIDRAVELANASRYALGAAVFARARGGELAAALRAGMVSVNAALAYAGVPALPFGGSGDSGFGRTHGEAGLREFAKTQSVTRQRFSVPWRPMRFGRGSRTARRLLRFARLRHRR